MTCLLYLSLGGNMGERQALMDAATRALHTLPGTRILARSTAYKSDADGPVKQDWFANLALIAESTMTTDAFISASREIEAALGRNRETEISWGPRPMDIDVIAQGRKSAPGFAQTAGKPLDTRPFVIVPMAEIAPDVSVDGITFRARSEATDTSMLEPLDWPPTISVG